MGIKDNITILVAVLNKKDTIKSCVESLLKLDSAPNRIMIVDGSSTDGTYEILQEYKNKIDLFQFKTGLSARLNWALDQIQTEYVALTDADCVVSPDWLDELIKGFEEKNVIATAGYCGTPKGLSLLPTLIGLELENRFKRFPKYIDRAPTMNLCLKTDVAKKVRFDEKQGVGVETDFGYRLTKLGKMVYMPKAKVFHYHRSTLKNFFKQQKSQAKWALRLIFKHGHQALADQITTFSMTIQIPVFALGLFFLLIGIFNKLFLCPALILFLILLIIYLKNIIEIKPPLSYYPAFLGLFVFRTIAWILGIAEGLLFFIAKFFNKFLRKL